MPYVNELGNDLLTVNKFYKSLNDFNQTQQIEISSSFWRIFPTVLKCTDEQKSRIRTNFKTKTGLHTVLGTKPEVNKLEDTQVCEHLKTKPHQNRIYLIQ